MTRPPDLTGGASTNPAHWHDGWYQPARAVKSPNFGPRPAGGSIWLAVIHAISLPPGQYGGPEIEQLFTNTLDWSAHPYFDQIRGLAVSAHFVLRRSGEIVQFVPVTARAWHAGASSWLGQPNCNDFSVGIELEGLEGEPFAPIQYTQLAQVLNALREVWPISHIAGHEHVAPGRKQDPGAGFDWAHLQSLLDWPPEAYPPQVQLG